MSLPKFDPWASRKRPDVSAYHAYFAYPEAELGTLGTIGRRADPNFSTNCEEVVLMWLRLLLAPKPCADDLNATTSPNAKLRAAAIEFCRGPWAARLAELGWQEQDLFAVDGDAGRQGGLVQVLNGRIRLATTSAAYFDTGTQLCAYVRGRPDLKMFPKILDLT